MRTQSIFILVACASLAWACTTKFSKDTDADGTSDPSDETDATADVEPDVPGDVPEDVPTDTIVPEVTCRLERSHDYLFPTGYGGTNIEAGCWTGTGGDFSCRRGGIWVQKLGSRIVVVYAGEQIIMDSAARAAADVIELADLDLMGTTPAASSFGMAYENSLSGASLLRRAEDEIILLYIVDQRESGGLDRESNIEVVAFDNPSGGTLDVEMNRLLTNPVNESVGDLIEPQAVRSHTTGRAHIFFGIRLDDGEGWETVQLWGNFMNPGGLRYNSFSRYTDFEPVVGDHTRMVFSTAPDCIDELVVLPWTEASLSPPILRSGAAVVDTSATGPGYGAPHITEFDGSREYVSSIAGSWLGPGEFAAAALATSALTMLGLNPPYDVLSTVVDASTVGPTVELPAHHSVDEPFLSEMEFFDFNDALVLHDQGSPVHFFVHPFFHAADGGTGHVWIFPLRPDGTPAGEPFEVSMGQTVPPGFDATMDPDTGNIFLVWMHDTADPSALERIPGYTLAEVTCD